MSLGIVAIILVQLLSWFIWLNDTRSENEDFVFNCVFQFSCNTLSYNLIGKSVWLMVFLSMGSGCVPNTTTLYLQRYIQNKNRWSCGLYLQAFHAGHHKLRSRSVFIQIQGYLSQRHSCKPQQESVEKWENFLRLLDKISPTGNGD